MSLSARRAWIEITSFPNCPDVRLSLSARRAWIEIGTQAVQNPYTMVALRKESVDRNCLGTNITLSTTVALRKESVDRN